MLIFRRSNCILTASDIVTLRKQLFSAPVELRADCGSNTMLIFRRSNYIVTASGIVTLHSVHRLS